MIQGTAEGADILRTCTMFGITLRAFRNQRKGTLDSEVNIDADKKRLRLTKKLVECKEYDAVIAHLNETKADVKNRSAQSFVSDGLFFVKNENVEKFEAILGQAVKRLNDEFIPALVKVWPDAVKGAELSLRSQFRVSDYPRSEDLASRFGIEWRWMKMTIPENLPADVRAREEKKLIKTMTDAQENILAALREAFAGLIDHAIDRMTPGADGKPKVIREAVVDNIRLFFETFSDRNVMGDVKLAALVKRAEAVLAGKETKQLRDDEDARRAVKEGFENVKKALDPMLAVKPSRKFNFDEE